MPILIAFAVGAAVVAPTTTAPVTAATARMPAVARALRMGSLLVDAWLTRRS
jgi:hypothetical protein